jgi:hypothetical protein
MLKAYGAYSASATGGNGWARDFLAGVLTVPATPFYTNIGAEKGLNLPYASTILFCISFLLIVAVYIIYWKGPVLRRNSPFAQSLANGEETFEGRRTSRTYSVAGVEARRRASRASASAANAHPHTAMDMGHVQPTERLPGDEVARERHHHVHDDSSPTQAGSSSRPGTPGQKTPKDRFGPGSRRSSYYSSIHAADRSRNGSRRNSAEVQDELSTQQGHGAPLRAGRDLSTIQSVATRPSK